MKISELLNKKNLIVFLLTIFSFNSLQANEPVDIWNVDNSEGNITVETESTNEINNEINMNAQTSDQILLVEQDETIEKEKNNLVGIFDPADNDLSINMWEFSDKNTIIKITKRINQLELSEDAKKIYNRVLLTNSFIPKKFNNEEFLSIKVDWMIKSKNLNLIKDFILSNNEQATNQKLLIFYLDEYLSNGDLENACGIFDSINILPESDYISKFKIYCLIHNEKKEIAQIQFDLVKEEGFKDKFFENNFNFLMGYTEKFDPNISEKNLLDFHLSQIVNDQFEFVPKDETKKIIWKYLKSFNLLENLDDVDIEDDEKIISIETATHNKNYPEKDLLNLYARYKFGIQQLLSVEESYKDLPPNQARALLYQGILLSKEDSVKISLLKLLKDSFKESKIENAFDEQLTEFLQKIDPKEVPGEYDYFYTYHLAKDEKEDKKIKFNNKILHQSKLINYFSGEMNIENSEKELNKILKKIKSNKKYFFSMKDKILLESLISDGVSLQFSQKDMSLFELNQANLPTDIENMISNGDIGTIMLRLVEIIGEDNLMDLGTEDHYFIITTLNKLNVDKIRNEIILEVLPLKV